MTNRDYINSLNNEAFAQFIYQNAITIGFSYSSSIQGLAEWLSKEQQLTPYEEEANDGK